MSPFNLRKVHNQKTSYSWSFPESNVRYIISECIGENDNPNAYIIYIDNELDLDWEVINRDPEKEYIPKIYTKNLISNIISICDSA